jgi:plastocyanin
MRLSTRTLASALICALAATTSAFAGNITGKVTYDDKVPALKPLRMDADPACASKHSGPVQQDVLVLGEGNGLANVFLQIKSPPTGNYPAPSSDVVINQEGCMYVPHVAGVRVGQKLMFLNSDGVLHNVHGLPKVNREFNIGMPPTLKEKETSFSKPEAVFPVKCDVHPWMKSYVAVMDHPFFAVSDANGGFTIPDVPDGTYEVIAWHEKLGTQTGSVTVSGGAAKLDFSFMIPKK